MMKESDDSVMMNGADASPGIPGAGGAALDDGMDGAASQCGTVMTSAGGDDKAADKAMAAVECDRALRQQVEMAGVPQMVCSGTVKSVDPDRIAIKRIVLTGLPTKIHKNSSVIQWMFHTPEDVKWFQPVEVWTKRGLQGHVKESLGDHGIMKCYFNQPIQMHDTVCMSLYKRVYPRMVPPEVL